MQAGKNAMASVKETASNIAASAVSGMDKTKATVQEKTERMTAHDPMQKEMATERKQEKIHGAERRKQENREYNAAAKQQVSGASGGVTSGFAGGAHTQGTGTGMNQMAALPGHGTGQPAGYTVPGSAEAHPGAGGETNQGYGTGVNAGTGRTGATDPGAGGETNQGYGTGVNAGTGRTVATNPRAGGETNQGYGTDGSYT